MRGTDHEFDRFLRAAHRRWVAWRVVERVGLATLCACALSLPLIAVLWQRGEPPLPVVAFVLGMGVVVGVVWGIVNRPTRLDTAIEADRQFHLHDLLSTSFLLPRCAYTDDATRATIAALADARCRRLAASRMVLNKLGARTWAGIGLAAALVLTLSLMTTSPTRTMARTNQEQAFDNPSQARRRFASNPPLNASSSRLPSAPSADPEESASLPGEPNDGAVSRSAEPTAGASDAGNGTGSASARADNRTPRTAPTPRAADARAGGSTHAGGAGIGTSTGASHDASALGASQPPGTSTPPWRAPAWNADRARALRAVERGAVPDAYRDLVRAYFDDADRR